MSEALYDMHLNFAIGNYNSTIHSAQLLPSSMERDVLLYRSYVEVDPNVVVSEVKGGSSVELDCVLLLARYKLAGDAASRARVVDDLRALLADGKVGARPLVQVLAGSLFVQEGLFDDTLRLVHRSDSLEVHALKVHTYLKMNCYDLAERELAAMQTVDEDSVLTILATAWMHVAAGEGSAHQAIEAFGELAERHGSTPLLMNAMTAAHFVLGQYDEAEQCIKMAMEKDARNVDAMINFVVLALRTNKPQDLIDRAVNQIESISPTHPWVLDRKNALESI